VSFMLTVVLRSVVALSRLRKLVSEKLDCFLISTFSLSNITTLFFAVIDAFAEKAVMFQTTRRHLAESQ